MARAARASLAALALALGSSAIAAAPAEDQALELLKRGIAFRTVIGEGNQTFEYATYLKEQLVAGGFAADDIVIERLEDTAWLAARYRGTGKGARGAKPIYISGHMDVVEAKPSDWERDPFTAIVENGYVYGRGTSDMKADLSTMVAALIDLKREGYKPARDIILLLSGDEETTMKTTQVLAERYHDADLLLNIDGGGGEYDEAGKPVIFGVQHAEKSYADYQLVFTNPGGHSSAPRKENAINSLAKALDKIAAHEWPAQVNEITKASFTTWAKRAEPKLADAMKRFVANPQDKEALATLRADPAYVGQTGTTCVATMVTAGHAPNALPQRAMANINCRIFPGTSTDAVKAEISRVVGDPGMAISEMNTGALATDASPVRKDFMDAVSKGIHARYADVPIVPAMSAGATDSMHFRARGVGSYGASPIFMKNSDQYAHGLNERVPVSEIGPSIVFYKGLLKAIAK